MTRTSHKNKRIRIAAEQPSQIFKMQRPIFDSAQRYGNALIYNEDRSICSQIKLAPDEVVTIFFHNDPEGEYKLFVKGHTDEVGRLVIEEWIPEKEWPLW